MTLVRTTTVSVKSSYLNYSRSGVNVSKGNELIHRIAKMNPYVGGFTGKFPLGKNYLIGCANGVGTKLKMTVEMNKHDTIGLDLVAMNVNNLITSGAKPLFFMDYYATVL